MYARKALNNMNYCSNCGQKREGIHEKHCIHCGRVWLQAPKKRSKIGIIVLCVVVTLTVVVGFIFKVVFDEAAAVTRSGTYAQTEEAITAYMKAAETVRKVSENPVASYSSSNVAGIGSGRYRISVPYEGRNLQGNPATKIATCDVHCDSGLCYVDHIDGL